MKKTIISLLLAVCLIHSSIVLAGKLKGKVQQSGDNGMISFSLNGNGGTALSSGVSRAFSFNPNVGIEVGWGNFGIGIDASTFSTQPAVDFTAYSAPLSGLDFLTIAGVKSNWRSTSLTLGPSYTIPFGNVAKRNSPIATLSFSVKGGVTMNQAPDFSVTNNSNQKQIASYTAPSDYKKNAFTLKPSVAFSYWFTQHIAVNANVQYAAQLGQTAFKTGYKDLTNVSIATPISPDQFTKNISSAPTVTSNTVGPDKFISLGIGLSYRFGGNWDRSVKGGNAQRKGWDGSIKGKNIAEKGITENGLKKNEADYILADAEVKAIAETLVNMRKGWDGSVKGGNITEKKGINEKGLKKNEAKSENINLYLTSTAQTVVNLARKGWDGSIKGNKVAYEPTETDLELVTETLESIRKGWDGSIKGNKTDYVANEAEVKAIAETMVNLRKGWDGSVKGNKKGINEKGLKKNESARKGWDGSIKGSNVSIPINGDVIHVQTTPEGCIVLFSDNGFAVNSKTKTMTVLSKTDHTSFGEKVNAGLHAAGGALAQGASLLGGSLPGGAVISAAVSSVSTTAESDGGAADSNTKTADKKKKKVWDSGRDDNCDGLMNIPDGEYELEVVYTEKSAEASATTTTTQVTISFSSISNVLKTKHDTAKNSVGNIR